MAGIYVHIPFCRKACSYCDFHFTTNLAKVDELVDAICFELKLRDHYLQGNEIASLYFGGGTPSLLSQVQLSRIIDAVNDRFELSKGAEITLEANPDDLSPEHLKALRSAGVNRLSIGIQSLNDDILTWMNRSHSSDQAKQCIVDAKAAGFNNISVDLIFGTGRSRRDLKAEIKEFIAFDVPHISAYSLTIEPGTLLNNRIQKKLEKPLNPEAAAEEFLLCHDMLGDAGYQHYEVSNYAKPGSRAKHNSSYWLSESYLGVGPSAHSFNGTSRQWNVSSNAVYLQKINAGEFAFEEENLSTTDRLNELLMTGLRTHLGVGRQSVVKMRGEEAWSQLLELAKPFIESADLNATEERLKATVKGWLILDHILAELFFE